MDMQGCSTAEAFFTGLLFRIQELNGRLESGSGPELDVEQVQRDFMDITKVLLAMVGCLFALLTPLIAATWWLLDHPALPQEHLNQVLTFMFGFLAPIERRLRPLLFVGLSVSAALGVTGGPADHDFLSREDGVSCAKRLLISLVLLNLVLSLILLVLALHATLDMSPLVLENAASSAIVCLQLCVELSDKLIHSCIIVLILSGIHTSVAHGQQRQGP
ncbi:hypothetical protein AK812_SmicGene36353 [Symbiodinium microadriaticum]|uniref:Uncharacterized protein n=1 Tax=Symbiodinium microadriaticum TaxID=2951 RepID=A0A1Q9CJ61_SYMMI|nr:hypothetical protein AK812_SmicGene36353 [Symbiodinium microadriaticum]